MDDFKKTGVYKIRNLINNKVYIGSAAGKYGIHQRFRDHKKTLKTNSHHNIHLQRAWNKYGEESFEFSILELCEKTLCIKKEQLHIDKLKPEYNICKTAGNTMGQNCEDFMTPDAIIKKRAKQSSSISKALKGIPKTDEHAIKCGANYFNVYKAICQRPRKRGQSAVYSKGEFIGTWLKRSDCSKALNINSELIRRCLKNIRPQTCGYIFEFESIICQN